MVWIPAVLVAFVVPAVLVGGGLAAVGLGFLRKRLSLALCGLAAWVCLAFANWRHSENMDWADETGSSGNLFEWTAMAGLACGLAALVLAWFFLRRRVD